jgi:cell division protein FtsB
MAKSKKDSAAAIRFGPALKAFFLCLLIAGSAVGYVWQKGQNYRLGKQISAAESRLAQLKNDNNKLDNQLAALSSPMALDLRTRSLGLVPAQPMQIVPLPEPLFESPANKNSGRQFAARQD